VAGAPRPHAASRRRDTRQRILDAATALFAAQGFRRVTVRDICQEAGANVAAVNYHFGDKLNLYREVLGAGVSAIREVTDEAIRLGRGQSAEDRLATYIEVHCRRIYSAAGRDGLKPSFLQQLIQREIQEPTPALETLIEQAFEPRFEYLGSIVSELLGTGPDALATIQCTASVHAQVIMFKPSPFIERLEPAVRRAFSLEAVTRHITAFCLAAIRGYPAQPRT
jgi:AcrR family transcriptional regulator